MAERHSVVGLAASAGIAVGLAAIAPSLKREVAPDVEPGSGTESLKRAIKAAVLALQALSKSAPPDSAAILDFQIEMLLDTAIVEMAAERIENGDNAVLAWIGAMDDYISGFEQSEEEVIQARAVDVIDIKNRVLDIMLGKPAGSFPVRSIYVGCDIEPSLFLAHDWSGGGGIVLFDGSPVSHVATLARARAIPMVIGTGNIELSSGQKLLVDGLNGRVVIDPQPADMPRAEPRSQGAGIPAQALVDTDEGRLLTADGIAVEVSININDPAELDRIDPATTAGIGLLRTEFAIPSPADIFNEEKQVAVYRRILEWAGGRPVTIRLFDFGGDKALPSIAGDHGSFLGLRGVRLLLAKSEMLRVQVRALLRAARFGQVSIMVPMVTIPGELEAVSRIVGEEADILSKRGTPYSMPPLGMMVEVPAAALMLDTFSQAAFFSFGTNDLGQYLAAAARDNPAVSALHAEAAPAIYRLIESSMERVATMNRPASICGDMASSPECLGNLLRCGLRHFSVAPPRLAAIKKTLATLNAGEKQTVAG
jgi:phosphotransferase system enzyme I (PtsI)